MSKSRRIATIAALPVALGLMFAGPAVASASTSTTSTHATTASTSTASTSTASHRNRGGLRLTLGGLLNNRDWEGRHHDDEFNLALDLDLDLVLGFDSHGDCDC